MPDLNAGHPNSQLHAGGIFIQNDKGDLLSQHKSSIVKLLTFGLLKLAFLGLGPQFTDGMSNWGSDNFEILRRMCHYQSKRS